MNLSNVSVTTGANYVTGNPQNTTSLAYDTHVVVLMCIAAGLCSLVTIAGNAIVILSYIINQTLRNFSNYLILSLAVSDFIVGAFSMNVFTTYTVYNEWILGTTMCKAWLTVDYTASNASALHLLVICLDRYLAVTKPVKYRKICTPKTAAVAIAMVWITSFLVWGPVIIMWDMLSPNPLPKDKCSLPFLQNNATLTVVTIAIPYYIPAIAMCALYWRVIYKLKERRNGTVTSPFSTSSFDERASQYRLTNKSDSAPKTPVPQQQPSPNKINGADVTVAIVPPNELSVLTPSTSPSSRLSTFSNVTSSVPAGQVFLGTNGACQREQMDSNANNGSLLKQTISAATGAERKSPSKNLNDEKGFERTGSFRQSVADRPVFKFSSLNRGATFSRSAARLQRERRVTVLLKFILLCFIILWLPYSLMVIITAACRSCIVPSHAWNLGYWLCYLNSTANPFCYGFCNENFRRTFKAIMTTRWWTEDSRKFLRTGRASVKKEKEAPSRDTSEIRRLIKQKYCKARTNGNK